MKTGSATGSNSTSVHIGDRYNRNRPFLVVTSNMRPANGVKTEKPGWIESGQIDISERSSIVDRVSDKMLVEATIIIDLLNSTLVKNRFVDADPTQVLEYYTRKYQEQITQGLQVRTDMLVKQSGKVQGTDA